LELPLSTLEYRLSTPSIQPFLARSAGGNCPLGISRNTDQGVHISIRACVNVRNYSYAFIDKALNPFCKPSTGACGCLVPTGDLWCTHGVLTGYSRTTSWGTCSVLERYSRRTRGVRGCVRVPVAAAPTLAPSRAPTTATPTSGAAPCPSRRPHAYACHCFCVSPDRCAWKDVHGYAHDTPIAGVADRRTHALD
jgi:hypothetical protein